MKDRAATNRCWRCGEMDVVLADEFRDGNVPAQMAPLTVPKRPSRRRLKR